MTVDRELLVSYLRQRAELGEKEVVLAGLERREAVELLRGARRALGDHAPAASPAPMSSATAVLDPPTPSVEAPAKPAAPQKTVVRERPTLDPMRALNVLREDAIACTRCGLRHGATQVVFGDGVATAEVVVVGEAPGADEDRTGVPFVGKAGRMLDLLLESVGFPRERVYICNVLKCRPPGNRDPQPNEVAECSPWLKRQIEIIRPRVILAVGRFAAQTLTASDAPMNRLRGRVHTYEGTPLVATYHPSYLLRTPGDVRKCWEDLQLLRRTFDAAAS
ncbi:MAG TPA: uracil-DNA glycosylase [Longimicrobiales bacterium]